MTASTPLYGQLFGFLRQYCRAKDLRHLKAVDWMVSALICSGELSLPAWEPFVPSRATKAQSVERRWRRWLGNARVEVNRLYLPLVMAALKDWSHPRLYLALDTTVLWNRYCMIYLSVVCCGRAVPLLWRVLEHGSATVAFEEYQPLLGYDNDSDEKESFAYFFEHYCGLTSIYKPLAIAQSRLLSF